MRANHGQPAVVFPDTRYRRGYELHGNEARDYWAARDKARAEVQALKAKFGRARTQGTGTGEC